MMGKRARNRAMDVCACGASIRRPATRCRACYMQQRRAGRSPGQQQWQNRCPCGQLKAKSAVQCQACRRAAGYMPMNYQQNGRQIRTHLSSTQLEFRNFLMLQQTRVRQGMRRMEQRIYTRKAAQEISAITPIIFKREALTVEIRGSRGHHSGGKGSRHD